jgi:6-pyruvoyltetrahydropterin/6-carboxytetrahydropterin synthase
VTVFVRCRDLDRIGLGIDFKVVKAALAEVLAALDHADLNAVPPFDKENPSTENIARHVFREMERRLGGGPGKVHRVRVSEGPNTAATYIAYA